MTEFRKVTYGTSKHLLAADQVKRPSSGILQLDNSSDVAQQLGPCQSVRHATKSSKVLYHATLL